MKYIDLLNELKNMTAEQLECEVMVMAEREAEDGEEPMCCKLGDSVSLYFTPQGAMMNPVTGKVTDDFYGIAEEGGGELLLPCNGPYLAINGCCIPTCKTDASPLFS